MQIRFLVKGTAFATLAHRLWQSESGTSLQEYCENRKGNLCVDSCCYLSPLHSN